MKFVIKGTTGHGSLLLSNTVGEKTRILFDRIDDFRNEQIKELEKNPLIGYSDVTSINLTIMQAGILSNVLPSQAILYYDVRLSINVDHAAFEQMLKNWCEEAGGDISIDFEIKEPYIEASGIDDTNVYWTKVKAACDEL